MAEYFEKEGLFKSKGATSITPEKYIINGEDIIIDNI